MIDILVLYALLATTFTVGKSAIQFCSPLMFIAVRMVIAGSGLLIFSYVRALRPISIAYRDFCLIARLILFHVIFAYSLEFWALAHLDSALVALAYNLSPFITALLGYLLYAIQLRGGQFVGLCLGFIGIIPLILAHDGASILENSNAPIWIYFVLLAAVSSACYGWLLVKQLVKFGSYTPPVVNGWAMFVGGLFCIGIACYIESAPFIQTTNAHQLWISRISIGQALTSQQQVILHVGLCLLWLIMISNVLFYNAYAYLLRRYSATLLSFAGMLTPLFAALFGYLVLHEAISTAFLLSATITSIGLTIFYQYE